MPADKPDSVKLADALRSIAKGNRRGVVIDGREHPQASLLLHAADALDDVKRCPHGCGPLDFVAVEADDSTSYICPRCRDEWTYYPTGTVALVSPSLIDHTVTLNEPMAVDACADAGSGYGEYMRCPLPKGHDGAHLGVVTW